VALDDVNNVFVWQGHAKCCDAAFATGARYGWIVALSWWQKEGCWPNFSNKYNYEISY